MASPIPPAVIRRVNRVRARIEPGLEEAEVILDDVFVLCRAFEGTWSGNGGEREQAEQAAIETIRAHGISALPQVRAFVGSLRAFVGASLLEIGEWFGSEHRTPADVKRELLTAVRVLQEAVTSGRWHDEDSRKLGKLIYRMRCAVVHPSLDTENSLTIPVLGALRAALVELTIARSAERFGVSLTDAQRAFDAALRSA